MRRIVAFVLASLLAVACGPTRAERAEAVRAARAAIGTPAAELGTLAEAARAAIVNVRLNGPQDPNVWADRVEAAAEGPVAALAETLAHANLVDLVGTFEEVAAAQEHWQRARAAAADLLVSADAQLDELRRVLSWDVRLRELTDAWQEPGSRQAQLDRFEEIAEQADLLGATIAAAAPTTCPQQRERRLAAARFVADSSRELREHIAEFRGTTFDERRIELADDPTGLGRPLNALDAEDEPCWLDAAGIDTGPLLDALGALQSSLNPADL
ncbi:MAG: hypothetical protein R3249_06785 [Nitriliruptorales bacterium]|nr:hypothetical protein [Nitriliruptorales bacterium]